MQEKSINLLSEGVQLCLHCGLCCQGFFHKQAAIHNDVDYLLAQQIGAVVSTDKKGARWFALPCSKFDGKCSVYPDRPSVCESHQCNLLQGVNSVEISLEKAKHISDQMKELCEFLDNGLNIVAPNADTKCIRIRFQPLFSSDEGEKKRKSHPHLFLKYAVYLKLKNDYFYKEEVDE